MEVNNHGERFPFTRSGDGEVLRPGDLVICEAPYWRTEPPTRERPHRDREPQRARLEQLGMMRRIWRVRWVSDDDVLGDEAYVDVADIVKRIGPGKVSEPAYRPKPRTRIKPGHTL